MAIVSVHEVHDGRGGETALAKQKSTRKHTRKFRVITNSVYDTSFEAVRAIGIPRLGSRHNSDFRAYCNNVKADADSKSKFVWYVTASYTTEAEREENPLADPPIIEWDTDTRMEPFYFDNSGDAILNSAGDYFEDTVKDEISFWSVSVTVNLANVPSWINLYRDAVNSDNIFIDGVPINAGMAKIKKIKIGKWQQRNDIWFREVSMGIKIQDDWTKKVINQGLRCFIPSVLGDGMALVRCVDSAGKPATRPMLLKPDGTQMALPITDPSTVTPLEFDLRNLKPFSYLGF